MTISMHTAIACLSTAMTLDAILFQIWRCDREAWSSSFILCPYTIIVHIKMFQKDDRLATIVWLYSFFHFFQPPKELLIQIRVLVPCGEIMTEYGPVNLSLKGSEQFVRRYDPRLNDICIRYHFYFYREQSFQMHKNAKLDEKSFIRTDVEHLIRHGHLEHVQWDGGKLW